MSISARPASRTRQPCALCFTYSLCLVLLGGACGDESPPQPPPAEVPFETRLAAAFEQLETRQMPVIVGVAHQGAPLVLREFGVLTQDRIAPEVTQIDVNSITKTVTALMVGTLVQQDKLRFEATLAQLLPDVPADKADITLHQLLTHTAGFPEAIGDDAEPLSRDAFLARALATPLQRKPGARYAYSNVGYGVLAAVLELQSEKTYDALLRGDVIASLDLADTGYQSVYDDTRSLRTAAGDSIRVASWGYHDPGWNLIGNGGLISSVPDLVRLLDALFARQLLAEDVLRQLETPHVAEDLRGRSHYGYGMVVQTVSGVGRVYWHDGGNDVFSAQWAKYVDQGDLIVTAGADSRAGDAFEAMEVLAEALYAAGR